MAKSVNLNVTDTPISGVSTLSLNRGLVNFGADFKVKSNVPGEVVLTNLTSPVSYPEKLRIAQSEIADVYAGTGVNASLYAPTRRGVSCVCQLTDVWKVVDSVDPTYEVALPISAHIVLKVPNNELITLPMIEATIGRLISGLYETGSDETTRLAAILRGSLVPSDL